MMKKREKVKLDERLAYNKMFLFMKEKNEYLQNIKS